MTTINERNVLTAIAFYSFSQKAIDMPLEWKFMFKIKNKRVACLSRRVITEGYMYINIHTNKIVCLGEVARDELNLNINDTIKIKPSQNKIGSFCDTQLFDTETYEDYITALVIKYYNKVIKKTSELENLTLLFLEISGLVKTHNLTFLTDTLDMCIKKYNDAYTLLSESIKPTFCNDVKHSKLMTCF